jgi:dolichyl-phosphate beta-glucosyltransferase
MGLRNDTARGGNQAFEIRCLRSEGRSTTELDERGSPARIASGGRPFLSVVIPAYNEERRIGPALDSVIAYLGAREQATEFIVVSDGSTDGTARVVDAARSQAVEFPQLRMELIAYRPNAGKGRAVRTGVLATTGTFVAFLDADLSTPVEEIDRALQYLDGASRGGAGTHDVVIASRAVEGAHIQQAQPAYRRWSAKFFGVLRDRIVGIRGFHDTQCGLKVFKGNVARGIFARQRIDGFMFDVETVFIAQRLGLSIVEMGVRWTDVSESKVKLSSGLRLIPDLVRIRRLHGRLRPTDRDQILPAS